MWSNVLSDLAYEDDRSCLEHSLHNKMKRTNLQPLVELCWDYCKWPLHSWKLHTFSIKFAAKILHVYHRYILWKKYINMQSDIYIVIKKCLISPAEAESSLGSSLMWPLTLTAVSDMGDVSPGVDTTEPESLADCMWCWCSGMKLPGSACSMPYDLCI